MVSNNAKKSKNHTKHWASLIIVSKSKMQCGCCNAMNGPAIWNLFDLFVAQRSFHFNHDHSFDLSDIIIIYLGKTLSKWSSTDLQTFVMSNMELCSEMKSIRKYLFKMVKKPDARRKNQQRKLCKWMYFNYNVSMAAVLNTWKNSEKTVIIVRGCSRRSPREKYV